MSELFIRLCRMSRRELLHMDRKCNRGNDNIDYSKYEDNLSAIYKQIVDLMFEIEKKGKEVEDDYSKGN